ncbi:MAG: SRPBCC family protein [Actinomycetota bacterium]|nr:SRPBCC family protein [Actinomycetota bacterium]
MEKLLNEFLVHRPIEQTWAVLTDVERIAPCMKGAELHEIEGDIYRGVVKVKLGPISTAFKGQAHFAERDDEHHRAVLNCEGRDTGGKGNAEAVITARLEAVSAETTKCVVESDIRFTGKVAQFGRLGVVRDTSEKLMNDFAHNLNAMLEAEGSATPAANLSSTAAGEGVTEPAAEPAADAAEAAPAGAAPAGAAPSSEAPTVRKIQGPAAEPIELSDVAGAAMLKRALPFFGGLVLLLLVLRRLRK